MAFVLFNLAAVAALVGIDQLIKLWASNVLQPVGAMPLIPHVVELRFVLNQGMAFSLLSGKQLFLIAATSCSSAVGSLRAVFPQPGQIPAAGRTHSGAGRRHRQPDRPCAQRRGGGLHQPAVHAVCGVQFCGDICVCVGVALWVLVIFLEELHADTEGPEGAVSHGTA